MKKLNLIILFSYLFLNQLHAQNINAGLVGYWPLDSNYFDSSGLGNNGTAVGLPIAGTNVNGDLNTSMSFNGTNQYIKVGDILDSVFAKSPNAVFSISFWANTKQISSTQGDNVIMAKSSGGSTGPYQWYMLHENTGNVVALISYASTAATNFYEVKSTNTIAANTWFHAVMTYDGTQSVNANRIKIYINKVGGIYSRSIGSGGTTTLNSAQEVTIGGTYASGNPVNCYNGSIDEVRIYNRLLDSNDISSLYSYKKINNYGPIAYWPLDSNYEDLSGNGYQGTPVGTPVFTTDVNGNPNKACIFNGNTQYVKYGDILDSVFAKNPSAKFSISFWAKTSQLSSVQGDNVLIAKSGAGANGPYQWYMAHEFDGSVIALISYSTLAATNFYEVKSKTKISAGDWFHAVLTYDGTDSVISNRLKIVVDKQQGVFSRSMGNGGSTSNNTTQEVTIGGTYSSGSPVNGYKGSLDEIKVYNYVLSNEQIDTLYAYKLPPVPYQAKGLVAYWPLDSNALDMAGSHYNGTSVNQPQATSDVNDNPNKAYSFNGSNQIIKCGDILDSLFAHKPTTKFSVSFWNKTNAISSIQGDNVMIAKSGAGSSGPYEWYIAHENNGSIVALVSYETVSATNFLEVKSSTTISANEWNHIIMTYDGTDTIANNRLKIFVNKVPGVFSRSAGPGGTSLSNTLQDITIGGSYYLGAPVNGYNGSLDEIKIYDFVLSNNQIDTLYSYKLPPIPYQSKGLVAYWPLDSNTLDVAGSHYDGMSLNQPTTTNDVNNKPNKSYSFNGSDQIIKCGDILDSLFAHKPTTKFSVSFWNKTNVISATQGDNVMIAKSGAGSNGPYEWYIAHENNGSIVALVSYETTAATNFLEVKSATTIPANEWNHIIMTFDGTDSIANNRLKIFVNKVPGVYSRSLGSGGRSLQNTIQELTIGGSYYSGSPINGYNGSLDEIKIYDYVLSNQQIDTLYAYKLPPAPYQSKGLVAHWPLDSNALDLAGSHYDGINVNDPIATADVNGLPNKAYAFNGTTQFIKCGDILDSLFTRKPATKFSISLWNKTNNLSLTQGDNVILAKAGAGSQGPYEWYIAHENNGSIVALVSYATTAATNFLEVKSSNEIPINLWNHVVMTYDGTDSNMLNRLKIYVNKDKGVYSRNMGLGGSTLTNTPQEITIGGTMMSNLTPVNGYEGALDEIRIYDYVLRQGEIDTLYQYNILNGLENVSSMPEISIYPNPNTDGLIHVQGLPQRGKFRATIYSTLGQILATQEISGADAKIQLTNNSSGIFLLTITNANGSQLMAKKIQLN